MTRPAAPPIARRMFLRGLAGVAVSLPFLESFAPRKAVAQVAPKRLRANRVRRSFLIEVRMKWR